MLDFHLSKEISLLYSTYNSFWVKTKRKEEKIVSSYLHR